MVPLRVDASSPEVYYKRQYKRFCPMASQWWFSKFLYLQAGRFSARCLSGNAGFCEFRRSGIAKLSGFDQE